MTYQTAHQQVQRVRGKAHEHPCISCRKQAHAWAYDHLDPEEKIEQGGKADGHAYSEDVTHYVAMCHLCHKDFDLGGWTGKRKSRVRTKAQLLLEGWA